jgi:ABC-2 type transport system ATP-binding protein
MSYAIQTRGLSKVFSDLVAVDGVDIQVKEGVIHGFIGPNGAGKSTTMKMLIGALHPTQGSGSIKGHPIGSMEARELMGFSPEHPKFYTDMTAHDYLVYMGRVCGMPSEKAVGRASELLRWLDLQSFRNKKVGGFSAGMKQKLSLAQSMIHEPEILILDEPTANLDPAGRLSIIENLKDLCREMKVTVFISSHILAELEKLVSAVTLLNHGRIVVESDVASLERKVSGNHYVLRTSENEKVLPLLTSRGWEGEVDSNGVIHLAGGGDQGQFRKDVTQVVLETGVWLKQFERETSDLEGIFMKLVGEGEEKQEPRKQAAVGGTKPFWRFWG